MSFDEGRCSWYQIPQIRSEDFGQNCGFWRNVTSAVACE